MIQIPFPLLLGFFAGIIFLQRWVADGSRGLCSGEIDRQQNQCNDALHCIRTFGDALQTTICDNGFFHQPRPKVLVGHIFSSMLCAFCPCLSKKA